MNKEIKIGNIVLTEENCKCLSCKRMNDYFEECEGDKKPDLRLEPNDYCPYYLNEKEQSQETVVGDNLYLPKEDGEYDEFLNKLVQSHENLKANIETAIIEGNDYKVNYIGDMLEVKKTVYDKTFSATVQMDPEWNQTMKELALEKAQLAIDEQANAYKEEYEQKLEEKNKENDLVFELTKIVNAEVEKRLNEAKETVEVKQSANNPECEAMLDGETKLSWFEQVTSWKRVVNAARRTIGKDKLEKDPSDSWKAKILLAEHSPIRLLEFDFGWEKIRQWVTAHMVRHHEGFEKFVHSQRGDRRKLPCDRDHIYQGARNDMDASVNAQGLINISRKRMCNCASKETREAWQMVVNELRKDNPVLADKCVPECVYRGFCPEWMSSCKYYKTDNYKQALARYRNTLYGNDVKYVYLPECFVVVSNTGQVYNVYEIVNKEETQSLKIPVTINENANPLKLYKYTDSNGFSQVKVTIGDRNFSVAFLVLYAFTDNKVSVIDSPKVAKKIVHYDDNIWNNNITNIYYDEE